MNPEAFFVYGTLRPDCGNDVLWRGDASHEPATLVGFEMFSTSHGGFPFIRYGLGTVVGDLVTPYVGEYDHMLYRMDQLEGEGSLYKREAVTVQTSQGDTEAWVYVGLAPTMIQRGTPIASGDWHDARRLRA